MRGKSEGSSANGLPEAKSVHYWKTSSSSPGRWIDRAVEEIKRAGGVVFGHAFGEAVAFGAQAFLLEFSFGEHRFRLVWPVLPHEPRDESAAKRQAATFLYHSVKARCMDAQVLGFRRAFFQNLLLEDGRTAADLAGGELVKLPPAFFSSTKALPEGKEDR